MSKRVMVIDSRQSYSASGQPFPPIGAVGTMISEFDEYSECDVMFDNFPCNVCLPDASWITHKSMIIFIDQHEQFNSTKQVKVVG